MGGETDLRTLLAGMRPELGEGVYVFCSLPKDEKAPEGIAPVGTFREGEGLSLILDLRDAEAAGLRWEFESRMITLGVHSSLEAVGLLAAVADTLSADGIAVNAISAFHHDHLFVERDKAERALELLEELASGG